MTGKFAHWAELITYALVLVSGGLGGCSAASYYFLRNGKTQLRMYAIASYFMIGGFSAVVFYLLEGWLFNITGCCETFDSLMATSMIIGFFAAVVIAATNISMSFILRQFGVVIHVDIEQKGAKDDQSKK